MRLPILLLLLPVFVFTSEEPDPHLLLTKQQQQELKKTLSKIVPVKIDKPPKNAEVDLFEVNEKSGVAGELFEGDITLTENQRAVMNHTSNKDSSRDKRQASTEFPKWTNNTVYYFFHSNLNDRKKASVAAALDHLQKNTCIRFVYSTTAKNRIIVTNHNGCYSSIGMIGGQQNLSLGENCEVVGTVAHEFTHALGFFHTQSRSDRDDYVIVDTEYLQPGSQINFEKLKPEENKITIPYELGGFMHYSSNAFIRKGVTGKFSIVPKDPRYAYTMGNRQISFYDMKMINDHYGCSDKCSASTSAKCKNGGLPNPNNCSVCICPHGYAGDLCDQRPTGCGETLNATSAWQTKQISLGDDSDWENTRDTYTLCNDWVTAPLGQKVQVKITDMFNSQCQHGCNFNGIEIKTEADPRITSPRICCSEFNNQTYTSELNPTPIIAFNRYRQTVFKIEYRAVESSEVSTTTKPTTTTSSSTTGSTPLTTPTTTTTTTTPSPLAYPNCKNSNNDVNCAGNVAAGYCSMTSRFTFQSIKFNCAKDCGLCGKAASPCIDLHPQCAEIKAVGMCSSLPPMQAEYHCAKTCGFCENPN